MPTIFRFISLLLRRRQSENAVKRILRNFGRWKEEQQHLPAYAVAGKKMLMVRLDDIGDYLLFRNSFGTYRESVRWKDHEIVLLGNSAWAALFVALDSEMADRIIWVNKEEYQCSAPYRLALWTRLRQEGFGTVVCPSRTRPLLLDDLCVIASGARQRIASANDFPHPAWNELSDSLYTDLFRGGDPNMHEFHFNVHFAEYCCEAPCLLQRPEIRGVFKRKILEDYILCFIGSSTKSKRWPVKRWIGLIQRVGKKRSWKIIIAGGRQELAMASVIRAATGVDSIVGKVSLAEMIDWVAGASAVITNDTMAAHLGASCNRPTLIIANGTHSRRFTEYAGAGIPGVNTVYPRVFQRKRKKKGDQSFHHMAVSADIASIKEGVVVGKLEEMIGQPAMKGGEAGR